MRLLRIIACIIVGLVVAQTGLAQSGRPTQDGRALDANRGVGTGGYNITRNDSRALNSSNRYITGNVTGLGSFRGYSPIRDPSQFQDGLPSAGLSFFNRQAVSTADVLAGQTQAGLAYYGRSETVVNTGGIIAGRNAPGSSMPLNSYTIPYRSNLSRPSVVEPELRDPQSLRNRGEALSPDAVTVYRPSAVDANNLPASGPPSLYSRATASSLFGADAARDVGREGSEALRSGRALDDDTDEPGPMKPRDEPGAGDPLPEISASPNPPKSLGESAFTDLLQAVRTAQQSDRAYLGNLSAARIADKARPATSNELLGFLSAEARQERTDAQTRREVIDTQKRAMANAAKWAADLLNTPISTFAAGGGSSVNELLAAGEREAKAGRYYDAQAMFERAQSLEPGNALIALARGHALTACGEYVSAVRALQDGLSRFPEAASLPLDLPALVGGKAVIDARCRDLTTLLERNDSASLRFLLGYLQYYSGDADAGLANLMRAGRAAPAGSLIARFPAMLVSP